jgi:hypothetical protein
MLNLNENQMKEHYFEGLFKQVTIRYPYEVNGKYIDFSLGCTNENLNKYFNKLYHKYKKKYSHIDFMNECMYHTNIAIQRFSVRDEGSWKGIIDGTDKANISRLISNIKTTVENELIRFMNDDVKFTRGEVDGEKGQHLKIKFNFTSLDTLLMGAEGEETTLINNVDSEQGFWSEKEGYNATHFSKWFKENKHRIITKSQKRLLDNLAKCQHERDGYTENDIKQVTGVDSYKINTYLKRIKERVLKCWEQENPMGNKTQLQMMKDKELEFWSGLMNIVYSDDVEQNKRISKWIINNLENEMLSNIIDDNLILECNISFVKSLKEGMEVQSKVLYELVAAVEERLDYLQTLNTESVQFYKKEEEMGVWTPEAHKEYANYHKAFTQQECLVYDKEGNLLRKEGWKPYKEVVNNLVEMHPTGVQHPINGQDGVA